MRKILATGGTLAMAAIALLAAMLWETRSTPRVRHATVVLPEWPAGARPLTVALLSDLHVGSLSMGRARLAGIVAQVNALHSDLILLAGDFIGHDRATPMSRRSSRRSADLTAPLGVIAVLGTHDYWTDPARVAETLREAGITVLVNSAVGRGPLAAGGIDDEPTGHDRMGETVTAMRALPGTKVLLGHSPDSAPEMPADL